MKQNDLGQPFGYLKASTALTCVNLFVMPYNYPALLPLLGKTPANPNRDAAGGCLTAFVPFRR